MNTDTGNRPAMDEQESGAENNKVSNKGDEKQESVQAADRLEGILRALRDSTGGNDGTADKDKQALEELIQDVRGKLGTPSPRCVQGAESCEKAAKKCVLLKVTAVEGKALVGELVDERTSSSAMKLFSLDLQFNGQRARTRKRVPCCVEPIFGNEAFVFVLREQQELPRNAGGWASFLQADLALHVALMKHRVPTKRPRRTTEGETDGDTSVQEWSLGDSHETELVGTAEVDWRGVSQNTGGVLLAVELASTTPDSIVHPVGGILHLRLEVIAPPEVGEVPFTAADVSRVIDLRVSIRSEERRDFYLYADSWWKSYTSASKGLHKRSVKIFAEDEGGQHRCVCSFIVPHHQGRLLQTPRHAARFVSLLPFQRRHSVGDQRLQCWNSPHASLAAGRGDCADHALLLCSLLLGFGLDAFVCVGHAYASGNDSEDQQENDKHGGDIQSPENDHMWVCTFSGSRNEKKAYFWESLTGQRFAVSPPPSRPTVSHKGRRAGSKSVRPHHFGRVACMFSHREFFANKQVEDRIGHTSLDVSDSRLWKPMDSKRIIPAGGCNNTPTGPAGVVLSAPTIDAETAAECIELELKESIASWRNKNQGLSTVWDDGMGYLLGPALFAYEQERVSGASLGSDDFQDAIQGAVPDKHCFKGYPTCFDQGASCDTIMVALLKNVISKDILHSRGDHLRFALRVMVFPFPDGVTAVWLMLACRFQSWAVA